MNRIKTVAIIGFIVIAIVGFFLMLAWFSGKFGLRQEKLYRIYFDNVSGLKVGDPVEVLGLVKGRVKTMQLEGDKVKVTIALSPEVKLTKDTKFAIRSLSYIGSDKYLFVKPGIGEPVPANSLFWGENESLNLELTFQKLDRLIDSLRPLQLGSTLNKTKDELINAIQSELKPFAGSVMNLTEVLSQLASRLDSLNDLLTKESTVKELLTSKEFYNELLTTNRQLQDLLQDIKNNPQKYIQLRLFK
ncbi:MAG: MlaD family protein [candidate division WOR-3 bacterium]